MFSLQLQMSLQFLNQGLDIDNFGTNLLQLGRYGLVEFLLSVEKKNIRRHVKEYKINYNLPVDEPFA